MQGRKGLGPPAGAHLVPFAKAVAGLVAGLRRHAGGDLKLELVEVPIFGNRHGGLFANDVAPQSPRFLAFGCLKEVLDPYNCDSACPLKM